MVQDSVLLGALAISAYWDLKERKVYLYTLFLVGIAGLVLHIIFQEPEIWDMLAGMGIGAVVLLAAYISRESIGFGDGAMLVVSGIFLGFWENIQLFLTALFLAGAAALFLLTIKRKGRTYRMPFLPFLLVAYLLQLL